MSRFPFICTPALNLVGLDSRKLLHYLVAGAEPLFLEIVAAPTLISDLEFAAGLLLAAADAASDSGAKLSATKTAAVANRMSDNLILAQMIYIDR